MKYIDGHILMVLFVEVKEIKISFTSILLSAVHSYDLYHIHITRHCLCLKSLNKINFLEFFNIYFDRET